MNNIKKNNRNLGHNTLSLDMAANLLQELRGLLVLDFSEESWGEASDVVRALSTCVSPEVYTMIGNIWSDSFVRPSIDRVDAEVSAILTAIQNENRVLAKI